MELVAILRILWQRRFLVVVGALVAIGIGAKLGLGSPPSTGFASTSIVIDTPRSQLVDTVAAGSQLVPTWAGLLGNLLASQPAKTQILDHADLREEELAVVDQSLLEPLVPASLPKAASAAAAASSEPYVLSVLVDEQLPILSIQASAPTQGGAARLARAAARALKERPPSHTLDLDPFVVESATPVRSVTVRGRRRPLRTLGVAVCVFALWCGGLAIAPGLGRVWRATGAVAP